jgi:hypothetical protein
MSPHGFLTDMAGPLTRPLSPRRHVWIMPTGDRQRRAQLGSNGRVLDRGLNRLAIATTVWILVLLLLVVLFIVWVTA